MGIEYCATAPEIFVVAPISAGEAVVRHIAYDVLNLIHPSHARNLDQSTRVWQKFEIVLATSRILVKGLSPVNYSQW
jgi:hypothetical protein